MDIENHDAPEQDRVKKITVNQYKHHEAGLDLVIVDYLQLMQATTTNRDANRVQEVSEISRGLKALARELSVPVIALSQLSRQPEMRTEGPISQSSPITVPAVSQVIGRITVSIPISTSASM